MIARYDKKNGVTIVEPIKVIKVKQTSVPKLIQRAQEVFNAFIRRRDKDKGCISCPGPVEQAGHYRSAGHFGELRFNEMNVNGQCVRCNCFLHGNLIDYRSGLVKRYGEGKVIYLESVRHSKKWSRTELLAIINEYKSKN